MNSQEVHDLLLLTDSDSEDYQMIDDDNDFTYNPEPGSDTSSEDESPRKKGRMYQG